MTAPSPSHFDLIRDKMLTAGVSHPAIEAFLGAVRRLGEGESGLLPEEHVEPILEITSYDSLPQTTDADLSLLKQLAVIKLNGGLGTGMGLAGPKSLLPVRGDDTFLDFIARQVLRLRRETGSSHPLFLLMNSFSTREPTLQYLQKYPALPNADGSLDFVQNKVPKLDPDSLRPVSCEDDPDLEWCPPGHGDLYPSLLANDRLLDRLLDEGIRFLFVSNADNLGATADLRLLRHFAASNLSFLMEVAARTDSDRKGGHLTHRKQDGRLVLRESAQCPDSDAHHFQDIARHRFFNTNNLWIQLEHLRETLNSHGGSLPLPLICNRKTVDPQNPKSPPVWQLESAMGAAIECFDHSDAVLIPRHRFAPVKTTNDLLAVRSDAYETFDDDTVLRLANSRDGRPPRIDLDSSHYKLLGDFDRFFPHGPPSLIACDSLSIEGPVLFKADVTIRGNVTIRNRSAAERTLAGGTYSDQTIEL